MERLACERDPEVRLAAGANCATPVDLVFALLLDKDPTVRHGLAEDPLTPIGVLRKLALDENAYVSHRAQMLLPACNLPKDPYIKYIDTSGKELDQWWTSKYEFADRSSNVNGLYGQGDRLDNIEFYVNRLNTPDIPTVLVNRPVG